MEKHSFLLTVVTTKHKIVVCEHTVGKYINEQLIIDLCLKMKLLGWAVTSLNRLLQVSKPNNSHSHLKKKKAKILWNCERNPLTVHAT